MASRAFSSHSRPSASLKEQGAWCGSRPDHPPSASHEERQSFGHMKPPPASHEEWSSINPVSPSDLRTLQQRTADRPLKVLSISCCDGIASISAAFSGLPVEVTHVISEIDTEALAVSEHRCKQAEFVGDLRSLNESYIRELVVTHDPDFIFVSGGTPCKQLSRASNDKSGLHGKDSGLFWAFRDVVVAAANAGNARQLHASSCGRTC